MLCFFQRSFYVVNVVAFSLSFFFLTGYWYYIFQFLPFVMFLYLSLPAVGNFLAFHLAGNSSLYLRGDSFGAAHKLTTFTR